MTSNGRLPLMEDNLWWKMTFDWRWPLIEDYLWRKIIFYGRQAFIEDELWWKTSVTEDKIWLKIIFDEIWPLIKEYLWLKTNFLERQPMVEDDLKWWISFGRIHFKILLCTTSTGSLFDHLVELTRVCLLLKCGKTSWLASVVLYTYMLIRILISRMYDRASPQYQLPILAR